MSCGVTVVEPADFAAGAGLGACFVFMASAGFFPLSACAPDVVEDFAEEAVGGLAAGFPHEKREATATAATVVRRVFMVSLEKRGA
jgi:hypothetical protein